jgi:hypothetical protein
MTPTQSQKNKILKTLSVFFVVGVLVASLFVYSTVAETARAQIVKMIPLHSVVEIPKVSVGANVFPDISRIDWGQKVNINGKNVALNSDEALSVLSFADDIKELIKVYRSDTDIKNNGLKFSIAKKLVEKGDLPADYLALEAQGLVETYGAVLDVKNMQSLDLTKAVGLGEQLEVKVAKVEKVLTTTQSLLTAGDSISDNVINYLLSEQNEDGSWGSGKTQFITTASVLDALQLAGVSGSGMDKGVAWISTYFADNTDYLAQKLKIIIRAGEPAMSAEILLSNQDSEDGGFSARDGYESDPLTTAKVIQTLHSAQYEDVGEEPNATQSLAFNYLIDTKLGDNGWSMFSGGTSNIQVTSEVIEALLLWRHRVFNGGGNVDETLDPALSTLSSAQLPNGSWENNILNTALAYHAIKSAGAIPAFDTKALEYFENEQESNGSFGNDIYKTAKVLKALLVSTESGQLVISDIIPISTLQTGATAEFKFVVSNSGNTPIDSGKIHIITDDFLYQSIDLSANNIVINAKSTLNITLGIANVRNFLGDVKFKVFAEGVNGVVHPESRYEEILTFLPDSANRPALPMYFVAYKSVSSAGTPAITWRWPAKADPNLNKYVVMFRKSGTTGWSAYDNLTYPSSNVTLSGPFLADEIYEVTLGTSSFAGNTYFFTSPVQIKTSASPTAYISGTVSGKVKALEGTVEGVNVFGVNTATNTTSSNGGNYTQSNVPWGSGYARVSDFRYENYINKYINGNVNLTDVDVFTNLRPDTQNPTVSNVSIVGESDKIIGNNQTKLIEYTVGDDIGGGGGIVKSVSLYYYDPHDSNWHLIAIEEGFLTGTRTYSWNIPSTLVGAGYKIKVVAKDFAGKESAPTEWGGTFELIANCVPPISGDWTIASSCTLVGTIKAPASVIVNAGKVLTLSPGSKLLIDLKNYKLLVKSTGGVLIKNTATLRQLKPSD